MASGTSAAAWLDPASVPQMPLAQRADLRCFQTTLRGGANVIAPPPPPLLSSVERGHQRLVSGGEDASLTVAGGGGGGAQRSLRDVWLKGMFGKAPELPNIDRSRIGVVDDARHTKTVLQLTAPEQFAFGRVQRPHVALVEIPLLSAVGSGGGDEADDGRVRHPKVRLAQHRAEVVGREAELALRDAYRAKGKLQKTCAINHPYGALGCMESPDHPTVGDASIYGPSAAALQQQWVASQRKAKGNGMQRESVVGSILSGGAPSSAEHAAALTWRGIKTFPSVNRDRVASAVSLT